MNLKASEAVHYLVDHLATSRAQVAEPQNRRKGGILSEEGVKSLAVGHIRRQLSVVAIRAQCLSLLGRLEIIGPGSSTMVERRRQDVCQEEMWRRERQAHNVASRQGFNALRKGFGRLHV